MAEHRRGANLPAIGSFNRVVILDAVRRAPEGVSGVELASLTALSPQTVSNVTRALLEDGLLVKAGTARTNGKPRTVLRLNARDRYAVGVHIDPAVVSYVLLDLYGETVASKQASTPDADDPDAVVAAIASEVRSLLDEAGVDTGSVLGAGIASPGPIDARAGVVLDPPYLPGWHNVPLRAALAEATGLPMLLEQDVTAAAIGHMFREHDGAARDFAFIYLGTGFGSGLILDQEPFRGSGANAGHIGRIRIDAEHLAPGESLDGCAEIGETVSPARLIQVAADRGILLPGTAGPEPAALTLAWAALGTAVANGDAAACRLATEVGTAIGRAAVILINLLDLSQVVLGGPFWSQIASLAAPAAEAAIRTSPLLFVRHDVEVLSSPHGGDVTAIGAACLVLDSTFSPRPGKLLIHQ